MEQNSHVIMAGMYVLACALLMLLTVFLFAAVSAAAAFLGVILIGNLTGVDNTGGALAMGAAGIMPIGALVGAVIGAWLGWLGIRRFGRRTVMRLGYGGVFLIAACIGAFFLNRELTDGDPYAPGAEPVVLVEWRLPQAEPHETITQRYRHSMQSTYMDWPLTTRWDEPFARDEAGTTVLRFRGEIRWRVTGRTFQLWQAPAHDDRITVDLRLPKDPPAAEEFGPWQEVETAPGHAFRTQVLR